MKGLIRNNIYSALPNLKNALYINLVMLVVPFIVGAEYVRIVITIQMFMFVANAAAPISMDVVSKWDKFQVTMPVRRKDIINARYITAIMMIIAGLAMAVLTIFISTSFGLTLDKDIVLFGLSTGLMISMGTVSFLYPLLLKIGCESSEIILLACSGLSTIIYIGMAFVISPFVDDAVRIGSNDILQITTIIVFIVLFIVSYFVSKTTYNKSEL